MRWVPIAGESGGYQNSGTLPLANPTGITSDARGAIDFPDAVNLAMQSDYNAWILQAFNAVEFALRTRAYHSRVDIGDEPPISTPGNLDEPGYQVEEGDLWFDTNFLDLNVFFDDNWISTTPSDVVREKELAAVRTEVEAATRELRNVNYRFINVEQKLNNETGQRLELAKDLADAVQVLTNSLDEYVPESIYSVDKEIIDFRLAALESADVDIDLSGYVTTETYDAAIDNLTTEINTRVNAAAVNSIVNTAKKVSLLRSQKQVI